MADSARPQRLCSEIQLFDLCHLEQCNHRSGRYCTNSEILSSFENLADEEYPARYVADEPGMGEEEDGPDYEGAFESDEYEDGDDMD